MAPDDKPRAWTLRPRPDWPPWKKKRVYAPEGWRDDEIEWVPIRDLDPAQSRAYTRDPMKAPGPAYPALIVSKNGKVIADGHHRYWLLMEGGYRGTVPVVRQKRAGADRG